MEPAELSTTVHTAPMLHADQVAAVIQQLKADQEQLLAQQREVIVEQVVRSLHDLGLVLPLQDSTRRSVKVSQCHSTTKPSQRLSPSKLEENLHSLVLHSLNESGLNYPHVQHNTYVPRVEETLRQTRPRGVNVLCDGREIIHTRPESEYTEVYTEVTAEYQQKIGGDSSEEHSRLNSVPRTAKMTPKRVTQQSPLLPIKSGKKPTASQGKRRRKAGRQIHSDDGEEDLDTVDTLFNSVRGKVGHKTLAILERSRALLDQTKHPERAQKVNSENSDTFVHRMRQRLAEAECLNASPEMEVCFTSSQRDRSGNLDCDNLASESNAEPTKPQDVGVDHNVDRANTCHGIEEELTATDSFGDGEGNSPPLDIEILRPPEHSPENENEWENELARQILTIYATSVKAKAAGSSPMKTPGNLDRPGSRPVQSAAAACGKKLGTSHSLPLIGQTSVVSHQQPRQQSAKSPTRAVNYSWEPSQRLHDGRVVINMPKVPKPIWFAGTGAVKSVWCGLAQGFQRLHSSSSSPKPRHPATMAVCEHRLCEEVRHMEAKQQYSQCITTLETLLVSLVRARGVDELDMKLWKQLVVTCNAFASRCVDYKKFPAALQLIKQAEHLIQNSILVDDSMRFELLAYLYDTYAHYYYKRRKGHAGLQYIFKAHDIHSRQSSWAHQAKCRLHIANLLSFQGKHRDAMAYMATILEMIEENKLEDHGEHGEGASAQKVCLAAVCYNNLAVEQLHLREFESASVSTGNAKRLAKLCLSYSNRLLAQFEATSDCVDLAIATLMEDANAASNAIYKATPKRRAPGYQTSSD